MTIPYCLPIIAQTKQEVQSIIDQNIDQYPYIEVWLDYITDLDEAFVKGLIEKLQGRLVLLFRRQKLETPKMTPELRQPYLSLLNGKQTYLDLDLETQQDDISYVLDNELQVQLLLSYHNYEKTPKVDTLTSLLLEMASYAPAIYKIATFCANEEDALRLISMQLHMKAEQKKYIILGMGEYGMITRIFGTLWGNEMIFAPQTSESQSAPGQLTRQQLENIFKDLNIQSERKN